MSDLWKVLVPGALVGLSAMLLLRRRGPAPTPNPNPIDAWGTRSDLASSTQLCDPTHKPGVEMFRDAVLARFGGYDAGDIRSCGIGGISEHHEGRAWDWGVLAYKGKPPADAEGCIAMLLANDAELVRRCGILYMIYKSRMWRSYGPRSWQPYTGEGGAHGDHVHFSFTVEGAAGRTSWYLDPSFA